MPKNNFQKGFTLVELLVVIAILAILAIIAIASLSIFQKNARDAKRQSDLKVIQSALEQYHADQNFYPTTGFISDTQGLTNLSGRPTPNPLPPQVTYLKTVPADPSTSTTYNYQPSPSTCDNTSTKYCSTYCLAAKLETPPTSNPCPTPSSSYNYTVAPQ